MQLKPCKILLHNHFSQLKFTWKKNFLSDTILFVCYIILEPDLLASCILTFCSSCWLANYIGKMKKKNCMRRINKGHMLLYLSQCLF